MRLYDAFDSLEDALKREVDWRVASYATAEPIDFTTEEVQSMALILNKVKEKLFTEEELYEDIDCSGYAE